MADGPCGEEFKAAFSCFVYSEAEPKGIDCVEKFRLMQECFRKHPDIYGDGASLEASLCLCHRLTCGAVSTLQRTTICTRRRKTLTWSRGQRRHWHCRISTS
jgi:intermembrane space import and assembly protein 40